MSNSPAVAPPAHARLGWSRTADWICALALLAVILVARPYRGLRHDAILYAGQVLARLLPDRVGTDLFFAYGSQDKYSVFSSMMAPLVERFGIGPTELVLLLLCNLLFAAACWNLIQSWLPRPLCWAAMLLMAGLPHTYGGLGWFSYAEPFLTARSFAEPLALLALSQLLKGRLLVAMLVALLGAAFHPLIVLPVIIIGWGCLLQQRRTWLWAGVLFAAPLALAFAGLSPFTALLQTFDGAWLPVIKANNTNVFIANNTILDWAALAFDVLVLALCLRIEAVVPVLRRLILAVLATVAVLSVFWAIGADLLHDVLLTQLQLWRVYWPLHLLAMCLLPTLAVAYWQRGWVGRWCVVAIGLAGVAAMSNWNTGWICIAWALLALSAEVTKVNISRGTATAAIVVSGLAMLLVSARVMQVTQMAVDQSADRFGHVPSVMIFIGLPLVVGLLALGFVRLAETGRRGRFVAAIVAAAGVVFGAGVWDQRSHWQLRLEADPRTASAPFEAAIPPAAVVYWDDSLAEPWLLARRANFFSSYQGAGLLFNRATAMEFVRRERIVAGFEVQRELCDAVARFSDKPDADAGGCPMSPDSVVEVCRAAPQLDFLVFKTPVDLPQVSEWHDAPGEPDAPTHTFHLYSCARLR